VDQEEAGRLLSERISELRGLPYGELRRRIGEPRWSLFGGMLEIGGERDDVWNDEMTGPSGARYQLEMQLLWDDRRRGHIRVVAAIDDGGSAARHPLTDGFIVAPDGRFIGE
jgi:hypothetical protein